MFRTLAGPTPAAAAARPPRRCCTLTTPSSSRLGAARAAALQRRRSTRARGDGARMPPLSDQDGRASCVAIQDLGAQKRTTALGSGAGASSRWVPAWPAFVAAAAVAVCRCSCGRRRRRSDGAARRCRPAGTARRRSQPRRAGLGHPQAGEEADADRVLGTGPLVAAFDGAVAAGLGDVAEALALLAAVQAVLAGVADVPLARAQGQRGEQQRPGQDGRAGGRRGFHVRFLPLGAGPARVRWRRRRLLRRLARFVHHSHRAYPEVRYSVFVCPARARNRGNPAFRASRSARYR
jgi:hypothetical protein